MESRRQKRANEINGATEKIGKNTKKIGTFIKEHKKQIAIGAAVTAAVVAGGIGAYKVSGIRKVNKAIVMNAVNNFGIDRPEKLTSSVTKFKNGSKMTTFHRTSANIKEGFLGPKMTVRKATTYRAPAGKITNNGNYLPLSGPITTNRSASTYTFGRGGNNNPVTNTKLSKSEINQLARTYDYLKKKYAFDI